MQMRNIILGVVISVGATLLSAGSANARQAEWKGGCVGTDYVMYDGEGNFIIAHNVKQCGGET